MTSAPADRPTRNASNLRVYGIAVLLGSLLVSGVVYDVFAGGSLGQALSLALLVMISGVVVVLHHTRLAVAAWAARSSATNGS